MHYSGFLAIAIGKFFKSAAVKIIHAEDAHFASTGAHHMIVNYNGADHLVTVRPILSTADVKPTPGTADKLLSQGGL